MTEAQNMIVRGPHSRETGITWGPFTLTEARQICRERGKGFVVIKAGDETEPNPLIYNHVDP